MRQFFGLTSFLLVSLCLAGARCKSPERQVTAPHRFVWDDTKVQAHLAVIAAEDHYLGSPRQAVLANYLSREAKSYGLQVSLDHFTAKVPDPALLGQTPSSIIQTLSIDLPAQNVLAKLEVPGSTCTLMLGSHYDSKRLEQQISLGANDSGSSSAALLEIMRQLVESKAPERLRCHVLAVWFDGEEAYLPEWNDGEIRHPAQQADHLYGSRNLAAQLQPCSAGMCLPQNLGGERLEAMILLDMIGRPNLRLTLDSNSDPQLLAKARELDRQLYSGRLFTSQSKPIEDDHIPFKQKGIPVLNLINFEDLSTWHTPADTIESLSSDSMREAGLLTLHLVDSVIAKDR